MSRQTIISDEDLLKGAQAIAADMKLPDGGRIKLARIVWAIMHKGGTFRERSYGIA